jgi:succinate dehydrogenase/fumarate reductase iron-sulfur protein
MTSPAPETKGALREGELLTLRIARRDTATDAAVRWETYEVPYAARMRVLDALEYVNERRGADVAYQWFCGARRCGQCAMVVNGEAKLTCWEPAERLMTIEPLRNLPLVRDLVVDRAPYEDRLRSLDPQVRRATPYPGFPEPLPAMEDVNTLSACIECLACHSECPVVAAGDRSFLGPAAIVQLGRFILDARDRRDLADISLTDAQVARCRSCRACEASCPAGIPIVPAAVEKVRNRILAITGR